MDFVRYAERAAALVNAPLSDVDDLRQFLADRAWLLPDVRADDAAALARLQHRLRSVFEASQRGDEATVVAGINELLAAHPITPYVAGHDAQSWHLHVSDRSSSVADLLAAEALMGLAILVCDLDATRLGVCRADPCRHVFVDTSPNQSRRYCSDRCSSRANVAAYRARRRAEAQGVAAAAKASTA
ncbi:MAG: CGNR zinc finger domain-containing protein [Actinomycetota bacterium]|nr:CGNR zinc finger domain-containing protein [Actinomycetota bacterium]